MVMAEVAPVRYRGTRIPAILECMERDEAWLARKMGVRQSTVHRVLRGHRGISPEFVAKASAALNLPADAIFIADCRAASGRPE